MRPRLNRRALLKGAALAGLGTAGLGAAVHIGRTEVSGEQLTSAARLPRPFQVPLPIPVTARARRAKDGSDHYELVQRRGEMEILPGLRTEVWGYDGTFPGTTLVGRSGRTTTVRVRNSLPVPTSTHLHGGVQAPSSDGYPTDLVVPPGYRHPPVGPGHGAHGRMAGMAGMRGGAPGDPAGWTLTSGVKTYTYPLDQPAATLWYHDHRMDFTAPQVWRGLAGMFLVHDEAEDALPLPRGDKDIPLMICDRAFDEDGALSYPALDPSLTGEPGVEEAYMEGVTGDVVLVNGAPWPELEVSDTLYRFRVVNASNARRYRLALEPGPGAGSGFVQIGSDSGLLGAPLHHDELPVAPGERFDILIDFAAYPRGSTVELVNTLGRGGTRRVMRFRISRRERETARIPKRIVEFATLRAEQAVAERRFDFRLTRGDDGMRMWTINKRPFDSARVLASPRLGTVERWRFSSDFHHPVHLHLAHFQVLARGTGGPLPSDVGWKDTVDVRPYEVVEVLARFSGQRGRYMLHCHNLEHEDMAMMANFEVV